jgi:type IV fimbrial biogenesis protein FimT
MTMRRPSRGFTLIELLFVVTLIGIMVAIAVPSFASFISNYRATSATNDLLQAFTVARAEALKQGRRVIVLPNLPDGTPSKTGIWTNGWTIFADVNNNQVFDSATETVIFKHEALPPTIAVAGPAGAAGIFGNANYVLYDGTGYPHTSLNAVSLGGIMLTDSTAGASKSNIRTLCLALLGRPRIIVQTPSTTCASG